MSDENVLKLINDLNISDIKELCYKGVTKTFDAVKTYCSRYFDGIKCWKEAAVGQMILEPCPDYVVGFDIVKSVSKTCGEAGFWLDDEETNDSSIYTNCISDEDFDVWDNITYIYVGGYSLSSFILFLALFIFFVFRKNVQCTRVRVHVNLFLALAISNMILLIWHFEVIRDAGVVLFNPIWCQVMHVFTYYSILTTHFWMFNEALHLYLAVAHVYSKHKDSLMLFLGIGWVSPAVVMAVYAAVRMFYLNDMENCCTGYSHAFYIISLVVFGSHIATFFLLLNVVGILYQKSKRFPRHNRMIAMIKATKAALVLTPLFALHYYLILKQLSRQNAVRHSYQVGSAVVVTLLGLFLAINFCFTNTDVIRSFNELFNPRKEAPVVNIAMTDMSGNHRDSQV